MFGSLFKFLFLASFAIAAFLVGLLVGGFFMGSGDKDLCASSQFGSEANPAAQLYDDLYGQKKEKERTVGLFELFFGGPEVKPKAPTNLGIPEQNFIEVTHWNRKLDSYQYSMNAVTASKAQAAAQYRRATFERALGKAFVDDLEPHVVQSLLKAEENLLEKGSKLVEKIQAIEVRRLQTALDSEMKKMGMSAVYELDPSTIRDLDEVQTYNESSKAALLDIQVYNESQQELHRLETDFLRTAVRAVGTRKAATIRVALLGDVAVRGMGGLLANLNERPLAKLLTNEPIGSKPKVFVTRFLGDPVASQVSNLREEVTAIVQTAKPGDEALVILKTGGGSLTGYGLATAQLLRFKEAGMKLTVAVDQVAASGGYMMCSVADRIVASPFAVLGSIGVVEEIPNIHERLQREGIEYQTITAGQYKRTLTSTKKVTDEDVKRTQEDVDKVFNLFKNFLVQNRPQIDIEKVGTGETWFGTDALDLKLCDEIKTADAVLTDYVDAGRDVFEIKYKRKSKGLVTKLLNLFSSCDSMSTSDAPLVEKAVRWLVRTITFELGIGEGAEEKL